MIKLNKKKVFKVLMILVGIFFLLSVLSTSVNAVGLIDETIDASKNYSKYPVDNYQLDYFVDSSWDWLPWNWGDGIGKSVMYGIYALTNLLWLFSIYLSNATGYLVGEAYSLDFISDTTEAIGRNIQTLAGINEHGFMNQGFYPGLLLLLVLVLGIYVAYTGLVKRETTKAVSAVVSFLTIFLLSSSFIAYSTSYVRRINEFSSDISNAALTIGSKMTVQDSGNSRKSSVDAIRDSLFEIQVKQPWMILQYGDSNLEAVGKERVEELEKTSPFQNKGKDRTEIIKKEINDLENDNMTITKTVTRIGVTIFIILFNLFISIFVFILTGIMIFSQVLFIIFAVFLPISFLLSMIPTFNHLMKKTIMRLFNVIMMRAGITLVLTLAFSLSAMVYGLTASQPFFIVAFMQIVIFAGIFFRLNDLMGMMALTSADSQNVGSRVMRRPRRIANRAMRRMTVGGLLLKGLGHNRSNSKKTGGDGKSNSDNKQTTSSSNRQKQTETKEATEKNKQKHLDKPKEKNNQLDPRKSDEKQQKKKNESKQKNPSQKKYGTPKKKEKKRRETRKRTLGQRKQSVLSPTPKRPSHSNQGKTLNHPPKRLIPKNHENPSFHRKQERQLQNGETLNRKLYAKRTIEEKRQEKSKEVKELRGKGMKRR
ncbi:CD3337/EF1877 family mobilome membrane protein [Enterococcus sp. DIV0187]|uniref:CD3337/EF1877 family mobilome membrane protein n=1 Tax=Enterococcus sp. DIV0187 TaxID=2774644 RepID=UPI003F687CEE